MRIYPGTTVDSEFASLGVDGFTGSLNDRQFAFLRDAGRTNSLADMMFQHANDTDPYASAIAAYDFTTASGYVLNTGRVETLIDLSPNGRNLGQTTAGDRPTVGTMTDGKTAGVYTNAEEWNFTDDATLGTLFNDAAAADFTVSFVVELDVISTTQTFVGWTDPATAVNEGWIGMNTTGDLRIFRENAVPAFNMIDSAPVFVATGTTYAVTVTFAGGLVNAWVNGTQVLTDQAFAAATPTIAATRFMIGARDQGTDTQGIEGRVHSVVIEANA